MAKPTLLQSMLGRPSQTYSFPPEKASYYSTKPQLLRIAAEQESEVTQDPAESEDDSDQDIFYTPRSSFVSTATTPAPDSSSTSTTTSISSLFEDIHSESTHQTTRSAHTDQDWALPRPPKRKPSSDPLFIPLRKASHFSKAKSKCTPSIMTSMTALLEEDEGGAVAEQRTHPPRSNVLISTPHPLRAAFSSQSHQPQKRPEQTLVATSSPVIRSSSTSSTATPRPRTSSASAHPHPQPRHQRSRSLTLPKTTPLTTLSPSSSYSPSLPSHGTPGYTSLILPRAPPSSIGVGKAAGVGIGEGKVDLTRSGVAQTTMASVEVVKGLGEERVGGNVFGGILRRRKTMGAGANKRGANAGAAGPLGFTSYRAPPSYVPAGSVLVQVWAVGVDGIDGRLVGGKVEGQNGSRDSRHDSREEGKGKGKGKGRLEVGYIPGRSFVGRVLECGWEVKEEVVRKGEWVVGLLDIRKCGALTEFIVTDRRRVHRVPHPRMRPAPHLLPGIAPISMLTRSNSNPNTPLAIQSAPPAQFHTSYTNESLTLEELALLPLCGVPAYRAVRTFTFALSATATATSTSSNPSSSHLHLKGRGAEAGNRALVLRGHRGAGAMVVQMLVHRGWRVSVHAPGPGDGDGEREQDYMRELEERVGAWGGEEVVFDDGEYIGGDGGMDDDGAVVRVMENLAEEGEMFDAVLDTVGGKEVWDAGERLLRVAGGGNAKRTRQFTTLVGDVPARVIPSAGDNFRAGLRLLKLGNMGRDRDKGWQVMGNDSVQAREGEDGKNKVKAKTKIGYAWVSVAQDVDWEGRDVRDSVGAVLEMAVNGAARPRVESVVPFERTPEVFTEGLQSGENPLSDGGTVVVKIVG